MRPSALSLPVRVVLIILLVSGVVGIAHYYASRTLMTDSLRDIQKHHARNAHALVTGDIAQGIEHVREVAWLLKQQPGLALAASLGEDPPSVRAARVKQIVQSLGPLLGTNIIEIFDAGENLIFSTHPPARRVNNPGIWGVFEALSGEDVMVTSAENGLMIRAIVPLATPRGIEAALAVGMRIDDQTLRKWVGTDGMALVLIDVNGNLLASSAGPQPIDHAMIRASLRSSKDVNHTYTGDWTTTTYFGMPIVDQTYIWIARQDSSTVFTSFGHARNLELVISVLLAAASALTLGWLAYRHTRAIFNLQREAETVITREFGEAAPRLGGSEIRQLTASVQLMEQRLVSRAHELRNSYDALEAAGRARNEFFASISHDLRTPINAILGYAHYARQSAGAGGNAGLNSDLDKLEASATALLFLVNDILDFARIESGRFEIQPATCDLDDILQSVADLIAPAAQQKNLQFVIDVDAAVSREIVIDPNRLRQILVNLCSNAVKFTPNGEIVLHVSAVRSAADPADQAAAVFTVRDTGTGISPEDQARVFAPFVRGAQASRRGQPGTGLGLALCKQLAELMGGRIELHSTPDVGTSVVVTFPATLKTVAPAARTGSRRRVAVVAANDTLRNALCRMLDGLGFAALGAVDFNALQLSIAEIRGENNIMATVITDTLPPQPPPAALAPADAGARPKWIILRNHHDLPGAGVAGLHQLRTPVTRTSLLAALQDNAALPAPVAAGTTCLLSGTRVLLAEDNLSNQEIAARALRGAGAEVVIAEDGAKAAAAASAQPFDVVVMDVQMPVMNGIEATQAIRRRPGLGNLPIIGLSASAVVGDRENCIQAGMTTYVTKPIAPDALVAVVARHVSRPVAPPADTQQPADAKARDIASPALAAIAAAGFDVQRGLIMTGDETQYFRTLKRFLTDAQQVVGQARQLLARNDVSAAIREVHGVAGDAGLLGAATIRQAAIAAEKALHAEEPDREQRLNALEALLDDIVRQLQDRGTPPAA